MLFWIQERGGWTLKYLVPKSAQQSSWRTDLNGKNHQVDGKPFRRALSGQLPSTVETPNAPDLLKERHGTAKSDINLKPFLPKINLKNKGKKGDWEPIPVIDGRSPIEKTEFSYGTDEQRNGKALSCCSAERETPWDRITLQKLQRDLLSASPNFFLIFVGSHF